MKQEKAQFLFLKMEEQFNVVEDSWGLRSIVPVGSDEAIGDIIFTGSHEACVNFNAKPAKPLWDKTSFTMPETDLGIKPKTLLNPEEANAHNSISTGGEYSEQIVYA